MTNQGFTEEFISQITNLKNSYILSLATAHLIHQDGVIPLLKNRTLQTESYLVPFSDIAILIENSKKFKNDDLEILSREYLMFSTRSLFIPLYEAFKGDEQRFCAVKDLDWFVFLRNIRNAVAHGIDAIWKVEKCGKSEVVYVRKYDNITIKIDEGWNNTPMKLEQIGGWDTVLDLIIFIEGEAKRLSNNPPS